MTQYRIPGNFKIGHIHLKVSNLERAIAFYDEVLGFDLNFNLGDFAFLSAGGYHHQIGLNTWESKGGNPPSHNTSGLYHFALNYPERKDLAIIVKRLVDHRYPIDGSADHTSHLAVYLRDPDGNGIELAWDRPRETWDGWRSNMTRAKVGQLNSPLNLDMLIAEATIAENSVA
jgi:catechol 2,3-dioxygenase